MKKIKSILILICAVASIEASASDAVLQYLNTYYGVQAPGGNGGQGFAINTTSLATPVNDAWFGQSNTVDVNSVIFGNSNYSGAGTGNYIFGNSNFIHRKWSMQLGWNNSDASVPNAGTTLMLGGNISASAPSTVYIGSSTTPYTNLVIALSTGGNTFSINNVNGATGSGAGLTNLGPTAFGSSAPPIFTNGLPTISAPSSGVTFSGAGNCDSGMTIAFTATAIGSGSNLVTVAFATARVNANYKVCLTPNSGGAAAAQFQAGLFVTGKSTTGFSIQTYGSDSGLSQPWLLDVIVQFTAP